jgi:hypothetical protein
MLGHIHRIQEKIATRFKELAKPKGGGGYITGPDMENVLLETRGHYPDMPVWEKIDQPRDNHFNIYILPLRMPLHEKLHAPMQDLQNQMIQDGLSPEQRQMSSLYEERFSHLWVAEIKRWNYHPVGISTFTREVSPGKNQSGIYWLSLIWLNLAQRNHHVLRNTVPYFKKWHPGFVVGRDHPIVNKSLKDYPEHLQNSTGSNPAWS